MYIHILDCLEFARGSVASYGTYLQAHEKHYRRPLGVPALQLI